MILSSVIYQMYDWDNKNIFGIIHCQIVKVTWSDEVKVKIEENWTISDIK